MTDHALGRNNLIKTDDSGSYIVLDSTLTPSLRRLYLDDNPIASREGIVGNGTTCYRARLPDSNDWKYVLKFKWRWARDRPEDELLRLAKEKNVWAAVSLDHYAELESTANLRRSLRWGKHRRFVRSQSAWRRSSTDTEQQKMVCDVNGLFDCTEETDNFFQNRILACVVTSPVGRPLHTFQSSTELLRVFRDAIRCHRSLYCDAKILHQDISPGNIIILDSDDEDKPKGMLIDLDSAKEITEEPAEDPGITGTRPFMAIGVLKGEDHTYRHDLESFLYVLLWMIITNQRDDPPESSRLRQWSAGDWDELATRKSLDMCQENFQCLLEEFAPAYRLLMPLAEILHRILFVPVDESISTKSDLSPRAVDSLYGEMISVFEGAISSQSRK